MEYRKEISEHDRLPRMEKVAGVLQKFPYACDRGLTTDGSILGKKITATLELDPNSHNTNEIWIFPHAVMV